MRGFHLVEPCGVGVGEGPGVGDNTMWADGHDHDDLKPAPEGGCPGMPGGSNLKDSPMQHSLSSGAKRCGRW